MEIVRFLLAGVASWFFPPAQYPAAAHVCAANAIAISTRIEVVNTANGRMSSCVVIGTGPFYGGRVLDVSPSVASDLDFIRAGTADVRIYTVVGHLKRCHREPRPQTCKTPPRECVLDLPKPAIVRCP